MKGDVTKFKAAIDGSTWGIMGFVTAVCAWPLLLDRSPAIIAISFLCVALCMVPFFSIRYEIDGEELVVYQFFKPSRFPIKKIQRIEATRSILSAPAPSLTKRLAIYFTERKVLRSSAPLIISPACREKFISKLLSINPDIIVNVPEK